MADPPLPAIFYRQLSTRAHIPHPFCVLENFLLKTPTMDDLPAKESYRSHRILDFARMGRSQGTGIIHRYGPPCRRSTSQRACPDRQDTTLKVQKRVASSYK